MVDGRVGAVYRSFMTRSVVARMILVSLLGLAWACKDGSDASGERAKGRPTSELAFDEPVADGQADLGTVYGRAMDELADTIVDKTRSAADAEYASFEEAQAAMQACLPQASLSTLDEVLAREGVEQAAMVEYMKGHPEEVQTIGARFESKLSEVEPDLARLIAKVAALAPEDQKERVHEQLRGLGYEHLVGAVQWRPVDDIVALQAAFAVARAQSRGVFLDARADWCMPCRQLEEKTFADETVKPVLRERFVPVRLDLTDPRAPAEALQKALHAEELPLVAVWDAEAVRQGTPTLEKIVEPTARIEVFVAPDELLEVLGR